MSSRPGTEYECDGPTCGTKETTSGGPPSGWGVHEEVNGTKKEYHFCCESCAGVWFVHRLWPKSDGEVGTDENE